MIRHKWIYNCRIFECPTLICKTIKIIWELQLPPIKEYNKENIDSKRGLVMKNCKMAILGAGSIAKTMARTVEKMSGVRMYAVASRSIERAQAFAKEFGIEKAYGSYEDLVKDPDVELVYIATPHSHHYEQAKLCLQYGKHVLCEKAFTANAKQAEEILQLAEEKRLLLTEAIWTRFLPMSAKINEIIESGTIGRPTLLTANLGYAIDQVPRMKDPALAGGALLDLGVYPINFASMIFGDQVEKVVSTAQLTERGVDAQNSITLCYPQGRMAVLHSTMLSLSDRQGVVNGTDGYLIADNINNCERIRVYNQDREEVASYDRPAQITGYEYEVEAAVWAIQNGEIECPQMPHKETLRIMRLMDSLRQEWGVTFPFE